MNKSSKWMVLASIATGAFMVFLDGSIVNIALPTLVNTFHTNFANTKWVVLIYFFTVTILLVPFGRLGDVIVKKKIYITGFVIFTIGSWLCGMANSLQYLNISRIIQGLGAAMITSLGFAIVTESFPLNERGKALGIVATVGSISFIAGPVLGGLLLDHFSWRYIFYINIPIGIFGIIMASRFILSDKTNTINMFDIKSAITLLIFISTLLMGITSIAKTGLNASSGALFAGSLITLTLFIILELNSSNPVMDLKLFKKRTYTIGLVTVISMFIAISGVLILLPFYLENILGFRSGKSGALIGVIPVFLGIASPISGFLADKFGTGKITIAGLLILIGGFIAASSLDSHTSVTDFIIRVLFIGLGIGFILTPATSAIMSSVPKERIGTSSGTLALFRTLGQALGVAILSAYWIRKTNIFFDITKNEITAKIMALQSTFTFVIIISSFLLLLNIYGLFRAEEGRT